MDVVTPDNLNIGFLREFMMLPTSYYETGAAIKFRKLKKFHDIVHRPEVNRDQPRGLVNCQHLNMFTPSPKSNHSYKSWFMLQRTSFSGLEPTTLKQHVLVAS